MAWPGLSVVNMARKRLATGFVVFASLLISGCFHTNNQVFSNDSFIAPTGLVGVFRSAPGKSDNILYVIEERENKHFRIEEFDLEPDQKLRLNNIYDVVFVPFGNRILAVNREITETGQIDYRPADGDPLEYFYVVMEPKDTGFRIAAVIVSPEDFEQGWFKKNGMTAKVSSGTIGRVGGAVTPAKVIAIVNHFLKKDDIEWVDLVPVQL